VRTDDRLPSLIAIGTLIRAFPPDLVEATVDRAGAREQRHRVLPAQLTLYFTLALWLFASSGYECVMARLAEGLTWVRRGLAKQKIPQASSLARARDRLGPEPLHLLFEGVAGPVATTMTEGAFWRGRRLISWGGTMLDVPDSPENYLAWGKPVGEAPHQPPCVQVFALAECATHAVIDATFGPCGLEEGRLARRMVRHLGPDMLLLADLRSPDHELWGAAARTGADLLWRVPNGYLPVGRPLSDGTYLVTTQSDSVLLPDTAIRVIECFPEDGDTEQSYSLATTLIDPDRAPRAELARLYPTPWSLRAALGVFATTSSGASKVRLRSTKPDGVAQEIWAMFCVHHAVRDVIAQLASS
jgi:transposase IS4-like protein